MKSVMECDGNLLGPFATDHGASDWALMRHRGAPGVEHRREADLDAQALGIGRNRAHCLRRSLEQEIVGDGLVVVGDGGDPHRQREHDVEVRASSLIIASKPEFLA